MHILNFCLEFQLNFFSLINFSRLHHTKGSEGYSFRRTSVTKRSFPLFHMLYSFIYPSNIWKFYHIWKFFSLFRLFGPFSYLTFFSATATSRIRCNLSSWDIAQLAFMDQNDFCFPFFFWIVFPWLSNYSVTGETEISFWKTEGIFTNLPLN